MQKGRMTPSLVTIVTTLGLALAAAPAFATTLPGYSGKVAPGSADSCMQEHNGAVVNTCPGSEIFYEIPLGVDNASHLVKATVSTYNPGGGSFGCTLYAASQAGDLIPGDQWYPGTGNTVFGLTVTVPVYGSVFLYCMVNGGGSIHNVTYTP